MKRMQWLAVAGVGVALLAGACSKAGGSSAPKKASGSTGTPAAKPNAPDVTPPGDIPDKQAFVAYTPPTGGFRVKVPEGWASTTSGGAVVFTDKYNSVRMETVDAEFAPTDGSAQLVEVPAIRAASKHFGPGSVTEVNRPAGNAIRIAYRADSDKNPVTGKTVRLDVERYEFWHAGKQVNLTLSGPQGADNVNPWRIVTESFRWQ